MGKIAVSRDLLALSRRAPRCNHFGSMAFSLEHPVFFGVFLEHDLSRRAMCGDPCGVTHPIGIQPSASFFETRRFSPPVACHTCVRVGVSALGWLPPYFLMSRTPSKPSFEVFEKSICNIQSRQDPHNTYIDENVEVCA